MFLFYLLPFLPSLVTTSKCGNNVEKNILITGLLGGKPTEKGGKKRVREIAIILCGSFFWNWIDLHTKKIFKVGH